MDNDALCYQRFLDGDESGFDELIRRYHDHLIWFIYRYVRHFETAEDLAADTFMELIVHKKRYHFKSSFKTYLFSIAKNKAVDHIRREKRIVFLPEETEADPDIGTIEETILQDEEMKAVKNVLSSLHEDYATFLHLFIFEGMSPDEIAIIMKKTKKQIGNIAYRAKQALRQRLEKEGIFFYEKPR